MKIGNDTITTKREPKRDEFNKSNKTAPTKQIEEEIKKAAYYRFLKRGGKTGNDQADWFEAEREVKKRYQSA